MIKCLSSKKRSAGNRDYWWYNLSSPEDWMTKESKITFILNDKNKEDRIGSIELRLNANNWYNRIISANSQLYKRRKIIKVHIVKENKSNKFIIYFGQVGDGIYPVFLKRE